jgi:hypothetical protein
MTDKPPASKGFDPLAARLVPGRATGIGGGRREPIDCGHFDITIARDGTWYYRGSPIGRLALVRLFSTVLRRTEDGTYWLETPVERGRITVEDAPFIAVELICKGDGKEQQLIFRTNIGDTVAADATHPLRVNHGERGPHPYILLRDGLEARLNRPVFYELVELGCEERVGEETLYGVWSKGRFFPLGRLMEG